MAIVSVNERHHGRTGTRDKKDSSLVRVFIVRTNSKGDGVGNVSNAIGIPRIGDAYNNGTEINLNYRAVRIEPRQMDESPYVWEVTVGYEVTNQDDEDPTNDPPVYAWSTANERVEMLKDSEGVKAVNVIGDPFDPAAEMDKAFTILTIERNEATYDSVAMDAYRNTLNKEPAFGYEKREGLLKAISARSQYDPDIGEYWKVTYELHFKKSADWSPSTTGITLLPNGTIPSTSFAAVTTIGPWDMTRRNIGTRYKRFSAATVLVTAGDAMGLQEVTAVDIATDGTRLPVGTDPIYFVLRPFADKSWTPLNLE